MDALSPTVVVVLEFLTYLFKKCDLGYSAINTARSALSTFIVIDGSPVGEHPTVVRFVKGVFNLKPSMPKNTMIWDSAVLVNYIKTMSISSTVPFRVLTLKFVTLLWLLSGQRGQTMSVLDVRNIVLTENCLKIRVGELLKTTRPGFHQKDIVLEAYTVDRRLCIVSLCKEYLRRRAELCDPGTTRLFIALRKPHSPVTKDTIARWVREVMKLAGIDVALFTPHSMRAASTSALARAKVPLHTILETAGWSRHDTFARFYDKPLQVDVSAGLLNQSQGH